MRLAMICRADDGGLGNQTWEIARHVRPARILIVMVGDGRGRFVPERYDGICDGPDRLIVPNPPEPEHMRWLLDGSDAIFTVEGCYQERLVSMCAHRQVPLYVHANPELYPARYREYAEDGLIRPLAPTEWERDRLGPHRLLPMPVARDRVTYRERTDARIWLHVSAPAMADRNGTRLVRAAVDEYHGPPIILHVAGPERPAGRARVGNVTVLPVAHADDYWALYDDADVLLLPRRYGGLSLVAQEALAAGMPVVCLNRHPESRWGGTIAVSVTDVSDVTTKGGRFDSHACDPSELARAMSAVADGDTMHTASRAADEHAARLDWHARLPEWRATLGLDREEAVA